MSNNWDKLEDSLNPICFNDIRKTVRANDFWHKILFLLDVYIFICFVLIVSSSKMNEPYKLNCYRILAFFSLVSMVAIPLEIRKMSLFEVSNENIFFIFMSNITASKFVIGKFLLGFIYLSIFLVLSIPVYFYIYFVGAIDFVRLLRIFYYSCLIPIPTLLFCVYEGVKDGKGTKLSISANNIMIFLGMLFDGCLIYVRLFMVEFIRDTDPTPTIFFIDLGLGVICLIIALFIYLFLYSYLIRTYPLSEASISLKPKSRKAFSYKLKKTKAQKSGDVDNLNAPIVSKEKVINKSPSELNQEIITQPSMVKDQEIKETPKAVAQEIVNKSSIIVNTDKKIKTSHNNISSDLEVYKKFGNVIKQKKAKNSPELLIKIIFTLFWIFALIFILIKNVIGFITIYAFFYVFPFFSIYFHSRDKIYDNRSKLEIPDDLMGKIIKFPFISGYVNGIVWLALIGFSYLFVLFLAFGIFEPMPGMVYRTTDIFPGGGFYVMFGFILNIFSWCFIGRFIAEKFLKEDPKDNKIVPTTFILIVGVSICSGILPKEPEHLNLWNYFVPIMPMLVDYLFFKKPLAFICNLFFFVVAIIPHLRSIVEQGNIYFTHKSDAADNIYS